jgi:hypothetical protein
MLHTVAHTLRADLRERLRRPAFLVVVALTALAGFAFSPPAEAPYTIIDLGGFRGESNAAWVGAMLTMLLTQFVGLLGFFYVRGAIAYDVDSGVGQILGAAPLRRPAYLLGKWLSSWAILGLLTAIVGLMGVVLLLARGAPGGLNLPDLLLPLLVIALPTMGLVAGFATLFDAARPLRGGAGSVIYFVLFLSTLGAGTLTVADPSGSSALGPSIVAACAAIYGPACGEQLAVGVVLGEGPVQTFVWPGMTWTMAVVAGQWLWAVVGLGLTLAGVMVFDGFVTRPVRAPRAAEPGPENVPTIIPPPPPETVTLSPVAPAKHTFGRVLLAELRLVLKGRPWWWYAGAAGLVMGSALSPASLAERWLLALAWIWPLLLLSELGTREHRFGTAPLLRSTPRATRRQLPAAWLAAVTVILLLGAGVAIPLALAGELAALLGLAVTALLIPALALALGTLSGTPRLFEIVYLILWYGALNGVPNLEMAPVGLSQIVARLLLTLALLGIAALGRRR